MARRTKDRPKPMPRSPMRDERPDLPDPDDQHPDSDSIRVMHYKAMLRLADSLHTQPPVAPSPEAIVFQTALEDEIRHTSLKVMVTAQDDALIMWFAIAGENVDDSKTVYLPTENLDDPDVVERTPFVPLDSAEDYKTLFKTIYFDYATDLPNTIFYLPLAGVRIRPQDDLPSDAFLLWYWFDMRSLKYVFQVGQSPNLDDEDIAVVVEHERILDFLGKLNDGIVTILEARKR